MAIKMIEENSLPIRILIADDDKVIADILKDLLSNQERTVEICHDGQEAADKIREGDFDLVMADLVMPKMGGLEVLKYAKEINPNVIVIIVTGYASLETAVTAIKEGAYDYIIKPCKLDEIKIVINRATDKIKLHKENQELLKKLQEAYHDLMVLDMKKEDKKVGTLNFFSSNMAYFHHLYNNTNPNYVDKLQTLSYLKETGMLNEQEFKDFKNYYLKMITTQDQCLTP
jgi:YesN/AraC family two-component response regulator